MHKFRAKDVEANRWADDLLAMFARQLGITDANDIKDFKVAGLAIMLADGLNPHVDGMNPKGIHDLTFQFNFQILLSELDTDSQSAIKSIFGDGITALPFTLIIYPRRCHINYGEKMKAISEFPNRCKTERTGRQALVDILGDVGSSYDYNSRCFTRDGYCRREKEMFPENEPNKEYIFAKAAIDKMVSYMHHCILAQLF